MSAKNEKNIECLGDVRIKNKRVLVREINGTETTIADLIRLSDKIVYARQHLKEIQPHTAAELAEVCPVIVTETKSGYACIGNRRVLTYVKIRLGLNERINVHIINTCNEMIRVIALVDMLIMPIIFAAGNALEVLSLPRIESKDDSAMVDNKSRAQNRWTVMKLKALSKSEFVTTNIEYVFTHFEWLTLEVVMAMILLSPPVIHNNKKGDNACQPLINRRSFNVAKNRLPGDTVVIAKRMNVNVYLNKLETFERLVVEPVHLQWKMAGKSIGYVFAHLVESDKDLLFVKKITQEMFADAIGYRMESMFNGFGVSRVGRLHSEEKEILAEYGICES